MHRSDRKTCNSHKVDVHYLPVYLGHSRGQSEDRNSSQKTHHIDRWMYQEQLWISKDNSINNGGKNLSWQIRKDRDRNKDAFQI